MSHDRKGRPANSPRIWITWEEHRRTRELAKSLQDVTLYEIGIEAPRVIRYMVLLGKTLMILMRERPAIVIVQSPSIVLALFMVTIGRFFTSDVIVDAHNEGLRPFYAKYNYLLPIYRYILKASDLTIVTNRRLAEYVRVNGGTPFVLEDRLPRFEHPRQVKLSGTHNIVFVCTFEKDEPFKAVIDSAGKIPPDICIYITGKKEKADRNIIRSAHRNIQFTGFLPDEDYANLLFSCDAVMDLTYMENCLVCGAYEALALNKPMILSDTHALRGYFSSGAVFTRNEPDAIARAVQDAIDQKEQLCNQTVALKKALQAAWDRKCRTLNQIIANPASHALYTGN